MSTVWEKLDENGIAEVHAFAKDYCGYLSVSKTEREIVANSIKLAEEAGFKPLKDVSGELKPGDKVYANNRGKSMCLFVIGEKPLTEGMNILGAHADSPRLDVKQNPLYEKEGLVLMDTHYYGGIKKYQWTARPMALHGVVCKKDGTSVNVVIGEKDDDPVIGFSDLLIHLAGKQMEKTGAKVVEGEQLDALVGSVPLKGEEKDPVKANLLKLLKETYDIEEDDFISAELEIVPAGPARDYGLDRSMIIGYGHDDKVCVYTALRAILDMDRPERTSCCLIVDKEEIGSVGATGMESRFFENIVCDILDRQGLTSMKNFNDSLSNSKMLSADVSAASDPNWPGVMDEKNTAYFGKGLCFNKYTGSRGKGGANDANPEFIAEIRKVLADNDVMFQTAEIGAVDVGGGGTIAFILAGKNMEVIDAGIPVQNMHAPSEVVSKADVYESYRAYRAFLKDIR
ncbi:MAG: aminopeptidase [Solobacterium sp.]|nr:aminopeptidase [Solobacterium sp.]